MIRPEARQMSSVKQLGYLVFEVGDLAAWGEFGAKVLGLQVVDSRGDDGFSLRMDGYRQRFFIEQGPADDLAAIGWEVEGPAELEAFARRFRDAGHQVTQEHCGRSGSAKRSGTHPCQRPSGKSKRDLLWPREGQRAVRIGSRCTLVSWPTSRASGTSWWPRRIRTSTKRSTRRCSG